MIKVELELSRAKHLADKKTKRGLDLFEKYIGRIEWLHPEPNNMFNVISKRKYVVYDVERERIAYEADKMEDIAKEFCTATSYVGRCYKSNTFSHLTIMYCLCNNVLDL